MWTHKSTPGISILRQRWAHASLLSPLQPHHAPSCPGTPPHTSIARPCYKARGLRRSTHSHIHKHTHAAPPRLTPAPTPPTTPLALPRSLPRTPMGTEVGCLTSAVASVVAGQRGSPWERLGLEYFLSQLPLSRPRLGTVPGGAPPSRDVTERHHLGWGLPWHHPPWLGLLPVQGEEGTALLLTPPGLFSSGQSGGTQRGTEQSTGTGWAGLGAGPSPTDPRPQSSSHIPGSPPQGLLRPAGSARAQKGRDGREIAHGWAGWGWRAL